MTSDILMPPRLVLDTNVVMDLFHFRALPLDPLMLAIRTKTVICLADERTLSELERVTGYKQFRLDEPGRRKLFEEYRVHITLIGTSPSGPTLPPLPKCRDPDDQMFLELAQRGDADLLISRDLLVLKLAKARQRPCSFGILTPEQALSRLFPDHNTATP